MDVPVVRIHLDDRILAVLGVENIQLMNRTDGPARAALSKAMKSDCLRQGLGGLSNAVS